MPGRTRLSRSPGVERLSMTYGDAPVEWRRGLYNTATHYYRNELS